LAGWNRLEIPVDFDSRYTAPGEFHELVNGNITPFIKGQSGDIAKGNAFFWIVFGDVPGATSGDIEKFGGKDGIARLFLGAHRVLLGEDGKLGKKLCLGHSLKS
jgi:hypothetical protein